MKIIHTDLKPANLLWFPEHGLCKVADVGCVRFEWEAELGEDDKVVTLPYRSIELLLGMRKLCPCIDMWALGCTVAELSVGQRVFQSTVMTSEVESRFFWSDRETM